MRRCIAIIWFLFLAAASAEVVDRIAVAVGNRAIKENQIDREIRLTDFLNGAALDLGSAAKRQATERLIDQTLIRAEMAKSSYPAPSEAEIGGVLSKVKQARFRNNGEYEQALKAYGISEAELKAHIAWQLQVLRFVDIRFEPAVRTQAVKNAKEPPLGERINAAFFSWLDESRKRSRIQFHDEVFQ